MAKGDTTANLIGYLGKATQWGREIWAPLELNGAVPVNIQDQHTRALCLDLIKALASPTTLSVRANPGVQTITVTSTTGFVDGVTVAIVCPDGCHFYFGKQVGAVAGQVVTLDTPIDDTYLVGSNAFPAAHHMNVDGSSTPQVFQIGPVGVATGIDIDVTRIMGYIQDGVAMDDAKFGGITALINGVVLRVGRISGVYTNLWNVKSNGEIGLLAFDATYADNAPAGEYGFRFRNSYAGPSKHGVTIRLAPGETLEAVVQDDLTDLSDFRITAQGHYVTN